MGADQKFDHRWYEIGSNRKHGTKYSIVEPGRYYVGLALQITDGVPLVLIENHRRNSDWVFRPIECFDVIDSRHSALWVSNFSTFYSEPQKKYVNRQEFAVKEWFEGDGNFWYNLFELKKRQLEIFTPLARHMNLEFQQSNVALTANPVDNEAVECANCNETWIPDHQFEMAMCPACGTVQNYPFKEIRR